jgi:hypothetical protein
LTAHGDDVAQPYLDFFRADCDSLYRVEHLLVNRKLLATFTHRELRAGQGADLLETREWAEPASGVIEASYS